MRPLGSHFRMRGFTAVEMMIVVLIVGIITAIAAPNMAALIRNQSVKTAAFDLFASLTLARSEAIKRNTSVTLTPTLGDWGRGWQLTDLNGNVLKQDRVLGPGEAIPVAVAVVGGPTVTFARNGRLNGAAAVQFTLTSSTVSAASGLQAFTRCVAVDLSGRPRTC